jgi:hypothetical protein
MRPAYVYCRMRAAAMARNVRGRGNTIRVCVPQVVAEATRLGNRNPTVCSHWIHGLHTYACMTRDKQEQHTVQYLQTRSQQPSGGADRSESQQSSSCSRFPNCTAQGTHYLHGGFGDQKDMTHDPATQMRPCPMITVLEQHVQGIKGGGGGARG